ncbi:hypothetical protein ACRYI5_03425 [Furfurilactobacillus sp. WILCCON 0119]
MNEKVALAGLQAMQPQKKANQHCNAGRPVKKILLEHIIYRKGGKRKWI